VIWTSDIRGNANICICNFRYFLKRLDGTDGQPDSWTDGVQNCIEQELHITVKSGKIYEGQVSSLLENTHS